MTFVSVVTTYIAQTIRQAQAGGVKIAAGDQEYAVFYTDPYAVYTGVIPFAQHRAAVKLVRKTNQVVWFSCTLRRRVSRLARDVSVFSEARPSYRGRPLFHLRLQPHQECSITGIALSPS